MASVVRYQPQASDVATGVAPATGSGVGMAQAGQAITQSAVQSLQMLALLGRQENATELAYQRGLAEMHSGQDHATAVEGLTAIRKEAVATNTPQLYKTKATEFLTQHVKDRSEAFSQVERANPSLYAAQVGNWYASLAAKISTEDSALAKELAIGNLQVRMKSISDNFTFGRIEDVVEQLGTLDADLDNMVRGSLLFQQDRFEALGTLTSNMLATRYALYQRDEPLQASNRFADDLRALQPFLDAARQAKLFEESAKGQEALMKQGAKGVHEQIILEHADRPIGEYLAIGKQFNIDPKDILGIYDNVRSSDYTYRNRRLAQDEADRTKESETLTTSLQSKWIDALLFPGQSVTTAGTVLSSIDQDIRDNSRKLTRADQQHLLAFKTTLMNAKENVSEDLDAFRNIQTKIRINPFMKGLETEVLHAQLKPATAKELLKDINQSREKLADEDKRKLHESVMKAMEIGTGLLNKWSPGGQDRYTLEAKNSFQNKILDMFYNGDSNTAPKEQREAWAAIKQDPSRATGIINAWAERDASKLYDKVIKSGSDLARRYGIDSLAKLNARVRAGQLEMNSQSGKDEVNAMKAFFYQSQSQTAYEKQIEDSSRTYEEQMGIQEITPPAPTERRKRK